jgi:hypothetical protein
VTGRGGALMDHGHAAAAQLALDAVGPAEGRGEQRGDVRHAITSQNTLWPMASGGTFHVFPAPPQGVRVLIAVTEGRKAGGVPGDWGRLGPRAPLPYTGPGVRIREYPPWPTGAAGRH